MWYPLDTQKLLVNKFSSEKRKVRSLVFGAHLHCMTSTGVIFLANLAICKEYPTPSVNIETTPNQKYTPTFIRFVVPLDCAFKQDNS